MTIQKETSTIRLLLIDDNSRYLVRLIRRLQSFGYQHLTSAGSAAKGQQSLQEQYFDIPETKTAIIISAHDMSKKGRKACGKK